MAATRTREATPEDRAAIERALQDAFADDRRVMANSVMAALRSAPRYVSIGRRPYIYIEDVQHALDQEVAR